MISARTLLVFVPHDIPGAILSHSLPQHIYLRPVRLWCEYRRGLWSYFGANATLLRRSSSALMERGGRCPNSSNVASGDHASHNFSISATIDIVIQYAILVYVRESVIYYVLYLRRLRSHNVVPFPCFVRHGGPQRFCYG